MAILEQLINKARTAKKKIVLPEGQDVRVVAAANKIIELGIATSVTVLGTENELQKSCKESGITTRNFNVIDPSKSADLDEYVSVIRDIRAKKGKDLSEDKAVEMMKNRLYYGAMMTNLDTVDGMVAGSIASTGDMLRSAFTVIGTAKGINTASSTFIMDLKQPTAGGVSTLFYADCAVIPEPDAETMVDIAVATSNTCRSLKGEQPRVAFLSFSTRGSGVHPIVDKVIKATELMKQKIKNENLDILVDGELQVDSAIVPKIAASKCSDSPLEGKANILIFPDLNAGNICYKITQRLAGADALGPALQGLAKPLNDLSRGCSSDDIVATAAITACQASV
ncbi:MAG TPA: phosphate acetyltransferase [Victivallales bacterium]|nr:phosphate acetyltransferase [Victivallales bacterium]